MSAKAIGPLEMVRQLCDAACGRADVAIQVGAGDIGTEEFAG